MTVADSSLPHRSSRKAWQSGCPLMVLALFTLTIVGCGRSHRPPQFKFDQEFPSRITQYGPVKFDFDLLNSKGNPFDPDEVNVELQLVCPDGAKIVHPAFFIRDYNVVLDHAKEVARDTGREHWEIRWTPTQSGQYEWKIVATMGRRTLAVSGKSLCAAEGRPGFVKPSTQDPQYFEFSDGSFFYPIGHVIRSPSDTRWRDNQPENVPVHLTLMDQRTFAYERWFEQMAANHENFCSIWMAPWWLGIEWSASYPGYEGLGRYNQVHAAQLDRIFAAAERHGIYVLLFVTNHGQLSSVTDPEWEASPYRKVNGGPVETASEFIQNAECERLTRQRLRYVLARWGYSPSLFGISLSSETDWFELHYGRRCDHPEEVVEGIAKPNYEVPRRPEMVKAWLQRMSNYIRATDVHHHPVTTQFSMPNQGHDEWKLPEFEFALNNCYEAAYPYFQKYTQTSGGTAEALFGWSRLHDLPNKPKLLAEWGGSHMQNSHGRLAADLHTGIWATAMTDCAGVTGFWWWNEIDYMNQYSEFKAVHQFVRGYDRRGKHLKSTQGIVTTLIQNSSGTQFINHPSRASLVLSNETEAFAYVYHRLMNSGHLHLNSADDSRFELSSDAFLAAPDSLRPGRYRIEFWDTTRGEIMESGQQLLGESGAESRQIALLPVRGDVALKVLRIGD